MGKYTVLSLITCVLFVSGCIGQGPVASVSCPGAGASNGLVIADFSFAYSPIYAGEKIDLDMAVENVGGETATLTSVEIFGPDTVMDEATGLQWESDQNVLLGPNEILEAPDADLEIPGEEYTQMWVLRAPAGLATRTPYTFNSRIKFKYETTFSAILTAMTSNYLRTLSVEGRNKMIDAGGLSQQCTSGGPILITAASGRHFVDPAEGTSITFKVSNVGSGYSYWKDGATVPPLDDGATVPPLDDDTRYKIKIGSGAGVDCTDAANPITLSKGKTGAFKCKFNPGAIQNKKDITFSIPIHYYYYVDSSADIMVEKSL